MSKTISVPHKGDSYAVTLHPNGKASVDGPCAGPGMDANIPETLTQVKAESVEEARSRAEVWLRKNR